jgi:hypothetical protein
MVRGGGSKTLHALQHGFDKAGVGKLLAQGFLPGIKHGFRGVLCGFACHGCVIQAEILAKGLLLRYTGCLVQ